MRVPHWIRSTAASLVVLLLSSCFSVSTVGTHPAPTAGGTGGISLRVFADDGSRRANRIGPRGLSSELSRQAGKLADGKAKWTTVFRSLDPAWTVMNLPPGRYRLHFPARLDEDGNVLRLDERDQFLQVNAGTVSDVTATLEHVNPAAVALGVVAAVAAAVLLHDWLKDHDLPLPPLPPPPPDLLDAAFYVTFDAGAGWQTGGGPAAPIATSHFPEDGAVVAAHRLRVTFALSAPVPVTHVKADGVKVLGEHSGLVPGTLEYEPDHGWLIWTPTDDLPRDDVFHVTLATDAVEDDEGSELPAPMTFTFRTTP